MTYSIVYDAINIKTTRFEKPAPLINPNELAAAICIGYRQAGVTPPKLRAGVTAGDFRSAFLKDIAGAPDINPQLITAIKEYPHENAVIDESAKETYDFGIHGESAL